MSTKIAVLFNLLIFYPIISFAAEKTKEEIERDNRVKTWFEEKFIHTVDFEVSISDYLNDDVVIVTKVPEPVAASTGLKAGDKILYVNGNTRRSIFLLQRYSEVGLSSIALVERDGQAFEVVIPPKGYDPSTNWLARTVINPFRPDSRTSKKPFDSELFAKVFDGDVSHLTSEQKVQVVMDYITSVSENPTVGLTGRKASGADLHRKYFNSKNICINGQINLDWTQTKVTQNSSGGVIDRQMVYEGKVYFDRRFSDVVSRYFNGHRPNIDNYNAVKHVMYKFGCMSPEFRVLTQNILMLSE